MLREDQSAALQELREAVAAGKRRICMQAPTGYGKTMLSSALVESARSRDKKVIFTVPMIDLIDQTVAMFASQGILDVGVIQADHRLSNWDQPIQICSVQTLMRRTIPKADVVLLDEVHKWFTFYERWLSKDKMPEWGDVPFIGLSATPWTKGLGSWFDHYYKASTIQEMIDAGNLSPFRVFAPAHPDLSGIRTVAGDYHEGELSERMSAAPLVADIVETWLKRGEWRPTLCYCVDRAHAKKVQQQFIAAGIPCGYQDMNTPAVDRRNKEGIWIEGRNTIRKKFHSGEYKVVTNVATLTTGVDWDVRCIIMARPTKSDMLMVQITGRGLRTAPGKDHCLILDHSDNHLRLGFVTDIDESYTGLHDGKTPQHENRTAGIRLPKECPECSYLKPPRMAKCPACGFVAKVVSKIEPEAGELRELRPKPKPKPIEIDRGLFFGELKAYAAQRGFQPGWASNKYREKFGVWPNGYKDAPLMPPSLETLSWIKSRNIAWAKSKQRDNRDNSRDWRQQWQR